MTTTVQLEPRPGLAKTNPKKSERRKATNTWFIEWCRRNHVSERDLVALWGLSKSVVHQIFELRRSIHLEDLPSIPRRYRAQFIAEFMAHACSPSQPPPPVVANAHG